MLRSSSRFSGILRAMPCKPCPKAERFARSFARRAAIASASLSQIQASACRPHRSNIFSSLSLREPAAQGLDFRLSIRSSAITVVQSTSAAEKEKGRPLRLSFRGKNRRQKAESRRQKVFENFFQPRKRH